MTKKTNRSNIVLFLFVQVLFIFLSNFILAQDFELTKSKILSVADAVLQKSSFYFVDQKSGKIYSSLTSVPSDAKLKPESPYNDWRYWNGVLHLAMINLSDLLNEEKYLDFAANNLKFMFDNYKYFEEKYNGENKWNYPFAQLFICEELDDCGAMGASLIEIYKSEKQPRYKEYIDKAANHIYKKQARLKDGTLVRTFPYKYTLWADDLYMGISFLCRMGEMTGDKKYFDDAVKQVINFHQYLFNAYNGLMYHCWYSDEQRPGVAFWGRANGWAMLAQVDLLERLPKNHPGRNELMCLLKKHIVGISRYQSASGLWHQLLDKVDSYLETSCSAMFTYAIARAVNMGIIDKRFLIIALKGWEGVISKITGNGDVEGVCTGTGTSDELIHYYTRPAPLNDVHGIGAVILAGTEIMRTMSKPDS
ncbi:MAG: glycoside hydrolase family 88 protein [Bacteroidota bacterium]